MASSKSKTNSRTILLSFAIILIILGILFTFSAPPQFYTIIADVYEDAPKASFTFEEEKENPIPDFVKNNSRFSISNLFLNRSLTIVNSTIYIYGKNVIKGDVKFINCRLKGGSSFINYYIKVVGSLSFYDTKISFKGSIIVENSKIQMNNVTVSKSSIYVKNGEFYGEEVILNGINIHLQQQDNIINLEYSGKAKIVSENASVSGSLRVSGDIAIEILDKSNVTLEIDISDSDEVEINAENATLGELYFQGETSLLSLDLYKIKSLRIDGLYAKHVSVKRFYVNSIDLNVASDAPIYIVENESLSIANDNIEALILINGNLTAKNIEAYSIYLRDVEIINISDSEIYEIRAYNGSNFEITNSNANYSLIENISRVMIKSSIIDQFYCLNAGNISISTTTSSLIFVENAYIVEIFDVDLKPSSLSIDANYSLHVKDVYVGIRDYSYTSPSIKIYNSTIIKLNGINGISELIVDGANLVNCSEVKYSSDDYQYLKIINITQAVFSFLIHESGRLYFSAINSNIRIECSKMNMYIHKLDSSYIEFIDSILVFGGIYPNVKEVKFNPISLRFKDCELENAIIGKKSIKITDDKSYFIINSSVEIIGNRSAIILWNSSASISNYNISFLGAIDSEVSLNNALIESIEVRNSILNGKNVNYERLTAEYSYISFEYDIEGEDKEYYYYRIMNLIESEMSILGNIKGKRVSIYYDFRYSSNIDINLKVEGEEYCRADFDIDYSSNVSASVEISGENSYIWFSIYRSENIRVYSSNRVWDLLVIKSRNVYVEALNDSAAWIYNSSNVLIEDFEGYSIEIEKSNDVMLKNIDVKSLSISRTKGISTENVNVKEDLHLYLTKEEIESVDLSGLCEGKIRIVVGRNEASLKLSDDEILYALDIDFLSVTGEARFIILVNVSSSLFKNLKAYQAISLGNKTVIRNSEFNRLKIYGGIAEVEKTNIGYLFSSANSSIIQSSIKSLSFRGKELYIDNSTLGPNGLWIEHSFNVTIINSDIYGEKDHAGLVLHGCKYFIAIGNLFANSGAGYKYDGTYCYWGGAPADTGGLVLYGVAHAIITRNDFYNNFLSLSIIYVKEAYIYLNNFWRSSAGDVLSKVDLNLSYMGYGNFWQALGIFSSGPYKPKFSPGGFDKYVFREEDFGEAVDYHPLKKPVKTRFLSTISSPKYISFAAMLIIADIILIYAIYAKYRRVFQRRIFQGEFT